MKKALQYLVIHCTATPEGREVSAADIRRWHTAPVSEGRPGLASGRIYRPFSLGRHGGAVGREQRGRIRGPVGNNKRRGWLQRCGAAYCLRWRLCRRRQDAEGHPNTRAEEALERYVIDFHEKNPKVKIVGHRDLPGVRKACPSFDVAAWLKSIGIECPQK